jgi:hypothetical protein
MEYLEQKQIVVDLVTSYVKQEGNSCGLSNITEEENSHIIDLGVSMLMTKWQLDNNAGSFVNFFVSNDLMKAIAYADQTALKGFKFFARLLYNTGMPIKLYEAIKNNLEINA